MSLLQFVIFFGSSETISAFYLEPETTVEIEGSSPFFATILENQQTSSQQQTFHPSKETGQGPPIFNNLQDLFQSFKTEPEPIAPTVIPDDSFDKFQKISSMMGAILSDAGIGTPLGAKKESQKSAEEEEKDAKDTEDAGEGSQRAAIIPGPAQWPLVAFNFENAFLRATCPQIYDDAAIIPAAETQLDSIINQYCSMISNIINLKNDQLNSMVTTLRKLALKKMVFQLASI